MSSKSHVAVTDAGGTRLPRSSKVVAKLPICSLGSVDKDVLKGTTFVREVVADIVIMAGKEGALFILAVLG